MAGALTLVSLSLYALLAAIAVAARMRYASRAEVLLATCVLWNALILLPVHVLGVAGVLTAGHLALASLATSSATLGASLAGAGAAGRHVRAVRAAIGGVVRLPVDALVETIRARSLVFVGVLAVLLIAPWTAWLSYLAPSDSWDGMWYHETMVGYAIQNRGYAPIALPMSLMQQANGYPRNCEMTNLWFVIFSDRKLLEVPQSLMAVPLVVATYLLARRFTDDRVTAMGFGCALLLMPGAVLELRSTYIDLHVAALLMAAGALATRPGMRVRDGWMAGLALALVTGAKSLALAWVPPLAVLAAVLLLVSSWRTRRAAALGAIAGCALLIVTMGAVTYLRNWIHFLNPLWPISYESTRLHFRWPGVTSLGSMDWNRPIKSVYAETATAPTPGKDYADTRSYGYGLAVPFMLVPLAAVLLVALVVSGARRGFRRLVLRSPGDEGDRRIAYAVLLVAVIAYGAAVSPALWQARYNIHVVAGMFLLVAWASGLPRGRRLGEGVASFAIVAFLINLWWAQPGWGFTVESALDFAKLPADERALHAAYGWSIADQVAEARERELGPGAVVAFTDDCTFPGPLWNEHYTNRLEFVPAALGANGALARIEELHARWFVVGPESALYAVIRAHPERWQEIGLASRGFATTAFRRIGS